MDPILKLQPHRTVHLQGFDDYGAAFALWGSSGTGFSDHRGGLQVRGKLGRKTSRLTPVFTSDPGFHDPGFHPGFPRLTPVFPRSFRFFRFRQTRFRQNTENTSPRFLQRSDIL